MPPYKEPRYDHFPNLPLLGDGTNSYPRSKARTRPRPRPPRACKSCAIRKLSCDKVRTEATWRASKADFTPIDRLGPDVIGAQVMAFSANTLRQQCHHLVERIPL